MAKLKLHDSKVISVAPIDFTSAFYIKLGRGGAWEADSIATGKLRLGWRECSLDDINRHRWNVLEKQIRLEFKDKPIGVATTDFNALRNIVESSPDDIWITFHQAKLWWTRLATGSVKKDKLSRYRQTAIPWSDRAANGQLLAINTLPGKIAQIQGFRGTVCRVQCADLFRRILNGIRSDLAIAIGVQRASLAKYLTDAVKELHWKDFEILVDLIFRAAGLVRVSVLGQHAKGYDLELREPITADRYVVQIKSRASRADLDRTVENFPAKDFRRVFFVVHSPENNLAGATDLPAHVEVVSPERLGELAMEAGLAKWLEDKVS